jgi:hypothetical protein
MYLRSFLDLDDARSRIANWLDDYQPAAALGAGLAHADRLCRSALRNVRPAAQPEYVQAYRGFESLPLHQDVCASRLSAT